MNKRLSHGFTILASYTWAKTIDTADPIDGLEFTRIGGGKVPDDKSISRFGRQLRPDVVEQLHQRVVAIARENNVVQGRKLRVNTTVVETNIHYPTDSTLLNDGVRVLTRVMKKITAVAGDAGARLRDHTRGVKRRLLEIVRASRDRSDKGQQKLKTAYGRLLSSVMRVVGQAKRFSAEIAARIKRGNRAVLRKARRQLDEMIPRVQQVIRQTRQRINRRRHTGRGQDRQPVRATNGGHPQRQGWQADRVWKAGQIQEAENQIVTQYTVFDLRPSDSELLIPSLQQHQFLFGCAPTMAAADAGFFSAANEVTAENMGVKRVAVPSQSTKSPQRKQRQKTRWFKEAMRWRTGCEGRIGVLKRRHGLNRSRYKGSDGMKRWVGLGVIADNIINIARAMTAASSES